MVEAGSGRSGGAYEVCAASYARYQGCLKAVATSCAGGGNTAYQQIPQPAARLPQAAPQPQAQQPTRVLSEQIEPRLTPPRPASWARNTTQPAPTPNIDKASLTRCTVKGKTITCDLMYEVAANREVSFCQEEFSLTVESKKEIAPSAVLLPGSPETACPTQKLFALIPARFQLQFKTSRARAGREARLTVFDVQTLSTQLQ